MPSSLAGLPQSGSCVVCSVLGLAPVVRSIESFSAVYDLLQQSMATAHTTPLCRHRACAMSLEPRRSVSCARFESLTIVLKDCISAGEHHDRDNAPTPTCSVTQLDIWPSIRGTARLLWRDPHFGDFLHHGNAQRVHHTTADPKPVTVSSCTCAEIGTNLEDWLVHVSTSQQSPDLCRKKTLVNRVLIATVTGTSVATFQGRITTDSFFRVA